MIMIIMFSDVISLGPDKVRRRLFFCKKGPMRNKQYRIDFIYHYQVMSNDPNVTIDCLFGT